jgi:hypothetical protein
MSGRAILTHNHFDHAGGVLLLKRRYGARVLAFSGGPDVDESIGDGQCLRVADGYLDVIHTLEHSSDSICLLHRESGCLFSGDTPLRERLKVYYVRRLTRWGNSAKKPCNNLNVYKINPTNQRGGIP